MRGGIELIVVDAQDHGEIGVAGGRGDQHPTGARVQVGRRPRAFRSHTGGLHHQVGAQVAPGQRGPVADGVIRDRRPAHDQPAGRGFHALAKAAVVAVVLQQMRGGAQLGQVVDTDDLSLGMALQQRPQGQAADPPKSVDSNSHDGSPRCHSAGIDWPSWPVRPHPVTVGFAALAVAVTGHRRSRAAYRDDAAGR